MSAGVNIKKLRELKNYTQAYMAEKLNLSVSGYGKIERDETEVTINRLKEIARILEVDEQTVLGFNENIVFNMSHNTTAHANGIVQNQQIIQDEGWKKAIENLEKENLHLKDMNNQLNAMINKLIK
jgi:transcriptional regulator with XRE-family HTH domain